MEGSREVNRRNWDERAPAHAASPDYAVDAFRTDPAYLSEVVRFDRPRLGDVTGLDAVHLQCHIGTDTLSLHRLGARMTGLDFSPASLREARALAAATGAEIAWVESDLYGALDVLSPAAFDLVYTGIGALCWLPDVGGWARIVAGLLRPGGRLFVRDVHPMLSAVDVVEGRLTLTMPYFEQSAPTVWDEPGTYVATDHEFETTTTHEWSHGLGEMVAALLAAGMEITGLAEHDSAPWNALKGLMTPDDHGEWRLVDAPERLAATFTLQARRR